MTLDQAKFIVRVLTYQRGFTDPDPTTARELKRIGERYNELKATLSFQDSAQQAQAEWLQQAAQPICPVERGEIGIVHAHVADLKK